MPRRNLLAIAAFAAALVACPVGAHAQTLGCQGHDSFDPALVERAQQRTAASADGVATQSMSQMGDLGLSTCGQARVVVIRVSFPAAEDGSEPAMTLPISQTDADVEALFNGGAGPLAASRPYESVNAYYRRASYGKLDLRAATVVDYTARYNRSYYETDTAALFYEALAGVDDRVDFAQCDANGDGKIDAVYLQYAGETGSWGSTWWPSMHTLDDDTHAFDGKLVRGTVLFSSDSASAQDASRTLIHETGHVLGLPDLYHYSDSQLGVRAMDLMFNNTGDIDGFCKWMLDWVDEDRITYVHVSAQGVDIRRGNGEVAHHDGSAEEALEAYSSDDSVTETGGFMVVSDDASILDGNLLCKFYLLQYATPAGNDAAGDGGETLGCGFRVFRVQADLNGDGSFVHSNTGGDAHDQLVEALLPSDDGSTAWEPGALYHAGMSASPRSTPSTNYGENLMKGYSGIGLSVVSDGADSGTVRIAYEPRPDEEPLTLTCLSEEPSSNCDVFEFQLSRSADFDAREDAPMAKIAVDGKEYDAQSWNYNESTRRLTVYAQLGPCEVKPTSKLQVKIPAGAFILAYDGDGQPSERSGEMTLDVPASGAADIEATGAYANAAISSDELRMLSDVFELGGERYFMVRRYSFDAERDELCVYRLAEGGKSCERVALAGATGLAEGGVSALKVVPLSDGAVLVRMTQADGSGCTDVAVDIAGGRVVAKRQPEPEEYQGATLVPLSVGAAAVARGDDDAWHLWGYRVEDGCIEVAQSAWTGDAAMAATKLVDAGEGCIGALTDGVGTDAGGSVELWRTADVPDASALATAQPGCSLRLPSNYSVVTARVANGCAYVMTVDNLGSDTSDYFVYRILKYGMDGRLVASTELGKLPIDFSLDIDLRVSAGGAVCASFARSDVANHLGDTRRFLLFDADLADKGEFTGYADSIGTWAGERWLALDWGIEFKEGEDQPVHWTLTRAMGTAGSGAASGGTGKTEAATASAAPTAERGLVDTGDHQFELVGVLLVAGAALAVAGIVLYRRGRR